MKPDKPISEVRDRVAELMAYPNAAGTEAIIPNVNDIPSTTDALLDAIEAEGFEWWRERLTRRWAAVRPDGEPHSRYVHKFVPDTGNRIDDLTRLLCAVLEVKEDKHGT